MTWLLALSFIPSHLGFDKLLWLQNWDISDYQMSEFLEFGAGEIFYFRGCNSFRFCLTPYFPVSFNNSEIIILYKIKLNDKKIISTRGKHITLIDFVFTPGLTTKRKAKIRNWCYKNSVIMWNIILQHDKLLSLRYHTNYYRAIWIHAVLRQNPVFPPIPNWNSSLLMHVETE